MIFDKWFSSKEKQPSTPAVPINVFNGGKSNEQNNQNILGYKYGLTPDWLFNSPYGKPREVDIVMLRRFAKSCWVQMVEQRIKRELYTTEYNLHNKDEKDEQTYDDLKEIVYDFFDLINKNQECLHDQINASFGDVAEADSGVWVKVFSEDSYSEQSVLLVDKNGQSTGETKTMRMLKPFGQRKLMEVRYYDGTTFLKHVDIYRNLQAYYQYQWSHPSGRPILFWPEEICYFMMNRRSESDYGYSPVQSIIQVIELLTHSMRWNKDFFNNNAIPDGLASIPNVDNQTIQKVQEAWTKEVKGQPSKVLFLNSAVDFVKLQNTGREMEWLDGQKWFMHLVFGIYGVSPVEAGFHENVNQGNQAGQERITIKSAIKPYYKMFERALNNDIIPELLQLPPKQVPFYFKFLPKDHVQEQIEFEQATTEVSLGLLTPNEYRSMKGLDPLPNGDEPRSPMMMQPQDRTGDKGSPRQREEQDVSSSKSLKKNDGTREEEETDDYVSFYHSQMKSWEQETLDAIKHLHHKNKTFGEFLQSLFNNVNTLGFEKRLRGIIRGLLDKGTAEAESELDVDVGRGGEYLVTIDRAVHEQLNGYLTPDGPWVGIKGVTRDLQTRIIKEVQDSLEQGLSNKQLSSRITELFDTVGKTQADRIARTESTRLINAGKIAAYRDSNLGVKKRYSAVMDDKTSDVCRRLNNKYSAGIDLNDYFLDDVSGKQFFHPPAHVNCRCVVEPVVDPR